MLAFMWWIIIGLFAGLLDVFWFQVGSQWVG